MQRAAVDGRAFRSEKTILLNFTFVIGKIPARRNKKTLFLTREQRSLEEHCCQAVCDIMQ